MVAMSADGILSKISSAMNHIATNGSCPLSIDRRTTSRAACAQVTPGSLAEPLPLRLVNVSLRRSLNNEVYAAILPKHKVWAFCGIATKWADGQHT